MPYNPIEASVHVTFSNIIQSESVFQRLQYKPGSLHFQDNLHNEDMYIKDMLDMFCYQKKELNPYRPLMYSFVQSLQHTYFSIHSVQMAKDVFLLKTDSVTVKNLQIEQQKCLGQFNQALDYYKSNKDTTSAMNIESIKEKTELMKTVFTDITPTLTKKERNTILYMANVAETFKSKFTQTEPLWLPKVPAP